MMTGKRTVSIKRALSYVNLPHQKYFPRIFYNQNILEAYTFLPGGFVGFVGGIVGVVVITTGHKKKTY